MKNVEKQKDGTWSLRPLYFWGLFCVYFCITAFAQWPKQLIWLGSWDNIAPLKKSFKKHPKTESLGNFQWYLIRNPHNYSLSIQNNTIKNKKNGKHILSYEDSVLPEEPTAGSRVNTITQPLWFAPLRALNPTRSGTHLITAPAPLTRKERYM